MHRRVLCVLGIVLSVLGGPARSGAQGKVIDFPGNPRLDAPVPRAEFEPPQPKLLAPEGTKGKVHVEISPNTGMPRLEAPPERAFTVIEAAAGSGNYMDERYFENSSHPDLPGLWENTTTHFGDQIHRLLQDYRNFYLTENILCVGVAVAAVAPIANTHADVGVRNWYQAQAGVGQSHTADQAADVFKSIGEYQYAIPVYLAMSFAGGLFSDCPVVAKVGEFGDRSWRALAVGAPMVGVLQYGLGSDRPYADNSHWQPFQSNHGVSGHAFVGAVPFLTAASMTDSYALKALLVAGSFGPAWSRVHTDDHYLSQVLLGWSIACLSVESVNQTESSWRIIPMAMPDGVGMGVLVKY